MYDEKLMDRLAKVLKDVVNGGEGSWQEKAQAVAEAMKERDADGDMEEFASWLEFITQGG